MSYQPEPSSVAARVIAYLAKQMPGYIASNAELSHELGAPASSFAGCLTASVNAGLVSKAFADDTGRSIGWVLWRRAPPVPQQEAPAQPPTPADTVPPPPDPVVEEIRSILDGKEQAAPAGEPFACALFNDGRLYLELGSESMTLQVEHTRALFAYLERVAL